MLDAKKHIVALPPTSFGAAYVNLRIKAESAHLIGGRPLRQALGLPADPGSIRFARIATERITHPVVVEWTGNESDIIDTRSLDERQGDVVVSEEFHRRLEGARLPPHVAIPVQAKKVNSVLSSRRSNHPEVPHVWLAWTRAQDLLDELDWSRSTFLYREHTLHGVLAEIDNPFSEVRCFGERSRFEEALAEAVDESDSAYAPVELVWLDPALNGLDLVVLPRLCNHEAYVSEKLARALMQPPALHGFTLASREGAHLFGAA